MTSEAHCTSEEKIHIIPLLQKEKSTELENENTGRPTHTETEIHQRKALFYRNSFPNPLLTKQIR